MSDQRDSIAESFSQYGHDKMNSDEAKPSSSSRTSSSTASWKRRVSTACLACKKSKRKCSGTAPCENCRTFHRVCIFDESLDQRRRVAAKRTADELSYHRDLLNDIFKLVREADETKALDLLEIIRHNASPDELRAFINDTLSGLDTSSSRTSADAASKLESMRELINVEGTTPVFRRKVMDIHYLCDEAPIKVPARPWTQVTGDDDLVSHLVSLYFTWDYPFNAFLDKDVFLKHMVNADPGSQFCSPFLVNALLSNACYFSEFSEAYVVPGDISSKGCDFLAEAERLRSELPLQPSLTTLQGLLLLYERYAMSRDDDLGYVRLHDAIRMGDTLGLVGNAGPKITSEQLSQDMDISCRRTAWGLFNVDTMIHTGFLRPSLINHVNMRRLDRDHMLDQSDWMPYPSHRDTRPSYFSLYFDESCNLSTISRDISRSMFASRSSILNPQQEQSRDVLYDRLQRWHEMLPEIFEWEKIPPYLMLLKMRYNALIINLFSCFPGSDPSSSAPSDEPQTPESPPPPSPDDHVPSKYNSIELTQTAARTIAHLARIHRREFGLHRAHHFALYTINLALFAMIEHPAFDVLDPDFLSLVSALSVVASRSALGRNLFHLFRQSVRAKAQGGRVRDSNWVSDELKEVLDEKAGSRGHGRFDEYASGLEKLNEKEKYHGIPGRGEGYGIQGYPGLGLSDMLDRYESLSLGKDDVFSERRRRRSRVVGFE
ncbi:hypothetical protein N7539_006979 [Penicillium diatomitis]|uniref:Zn(2)-C6 fungal-type domain-containing protein n=1 Tax=Penicillium diatomitis TaxID=2819901 RepID=A0A9X0BSF8_9EURO|nr:uncharacterized protein N7539_006979 [Penicillium diatomitis]KAJ5481085.1 hypothetical protein N7539_006979 [Penicillium diatomitis]